MDVVLGGCASSKFHVEIHRHALADRQECSQQRRHCFRETLQDREVIVKWVRGQRAVLKSSMGSNGTIRVEEGFQLPDATANEGDID